MQFVAKYSAVEALPVNLAGHDRMVFTAEGKFHIMPVDLFELLYVHAPVVAAAPELLAAVAKKISKAVSAPAAPAEKKARRMGRPRNSDPKPTPRVPTPRAQAFVAIAETLPTSTVHAVFLAIKEAPRTMHEVIDRVLMAFPGASRGTVAGYVSTEIKEGRAERRDDPETQLTKLYSVGSK